MTDAETLCPVRASAKDGYLCTDDGKPCQKIFTEKVLTYTTKYDILRVWKATKAIQFSSYYGKVDVQ